ncbi:MAG: SMC-Scp complex subunit ScpB [Sphingobacteriales bacterium]|jgi:segregation and condensation protein B|nr:MAG: SMC-Scp complex subunit ScpB [Sphingobacteriales bacterium]
MESLQINIEAILFAAESPVRLDELLKHINKDNPEPIDEAQIIDTIQLIQEKYQNEMFPFQIGEVGGGYQFLTKPAYHEIVSAYLNRNTVKRLTQAALEVLAIIAYKQPITKNLIEVIRGVNADYTVQKLMEKELIEISGRSEEPGKPLLYKTTQQFLDYFGVNSIDELPKLKEFEDIQNQIGEKENIENIAQQN